MNWKRALNLLILAALLPSCGEEAKDPNTLPSKVTFDEILGIIYEGQNSRLENQGDFQPFEGRVAATFESSGDSKTFTISYSNFREPSLCSFGQNCSCTGILRGTFEKTEIAPAVSGPIVPTSYDPTAPPATIPISDDSNSAITRTYLLVKINFQESSLSSGCPVQLDRSMKISVYRDKRMIITDLGRETLFSPRLSR